METFKSIVTFTFSGDGYLGKEFVNLIQEKYQAKFLDQSTYGIPNMDLGKSDIAELCLKILDGNDYNYTKDDTVRLFKPVEEKRLSMYEIKPYCVQSKDSAYNRELRDVQSLARKIEKNK